MTAGILPGVLRHHDCSGSSHLWWPKDEHETLICIVVLTCEWERGNGTYKNEEISWLFFLLNFHYQPAINSGLNARAGKPPYQNLKRPSSLAASG